MRQIVYYVAVSIDGYISGPNDNIEGFVPTGDGVEQYLKDLQAFDTTIMGRNTYEFGYKYGLKSGQKAYPHMKHYIFSSSLTFAQADPDVHVCKPDIETIKRLKNEKGTPIYLTGGGEFAGWLLDHGMIDVLKIKLNPLILGKGIRIFGNSSSKYSLQLTDCTRYTNGLAVITYTIHYPPLPENS